MPGENDSGMATVRREAVTVDPLFPGGSIQENAEVSAISMVVPLTIDDYLATFLSSCKILPFDTAFAQCSLKGLQDLTKAGAWKEVVEMSDKLVKSNPDYENYQSPNSSELSLPWQYRLEGLFRLKLFDELSQEVAQVISSEEERLTQLRQNEFTPFESEICLNMRILLSEVKLMTGRIGEASESLHTLQSWLLGLRSLDAGNIARHSQTELTLMRVQCSIVNVYVRQRQWRMVIAELNNMLVQVQSSIEYHQQKGKAPPKSLVHSQIVLKCLLSRTLLQVGAMRASMLFSEQAWSALSDSDDDNNNNNNNNNNEPQNLAASVVWDQVQVTRGLVFFARDKFEEAKIVFQSVIDRHQRNAKVADNLAPSQEAADFFASSLVGGVSSIGISTEKEPSNSTAASLFGTFNVDEEAEFNRKTNHDSKLGMIVLSHPFLSSDCHNSLLAVAVNNFSICCLFLKQVTRAVSVMENLIMENPAKHLCDPIVFNLCTLYDLSCAPELSSIKKKVLQRVAVEYHMNDPILHWQSFRLN